MGLSTNDYTTAEKDKLATIEPDANFYEHPIHSSHSLGLYKITVDESGHVSDATIVKKEDIVALGIPEQDTTYVDETLSIPGQAADAKATGDAIANALTEANTYSDNAANKKVPLSGGEMTGALTAPQLQVKQQSGSTQAIRFLNEAGNMKLTIYPGSNGNLYVRQIDPDTQKSERFKLPELTPGITADVTYKILTSKEPVSIGEGGTGATTAADARAKLGVTPENIGASKTDHTHNDLNTKNGQVVLGTDINDLGGYNHWFRPERVENNHYALGSEISPWDRAYIDKLTAPSGTLNVTSPLSLNTALDIANGGTGKTTHKSNAILTGNGTSAVKNVTTASGAFYATEANGAAKFGTLPIAQGGTGAVNVAGIRKNLGIVTNQENLLDNSYFANPINQGGKTDYLSVVGYTIDRWKTTDMLNVSIKNGYINLSCTSDTLNNGLYQIIAPEKRPAPGTKVTFACMDADGVIYFGSCNMPETGLATVIYANDFLGVVYPTSVSIMVKPNCSTNIVWAAFYEGEYTADTLPEYRYKGYLNEYNECLRYYWKPQYAACTGFAYSASTIYAFWNVPAKMRTTPTFVIPDNFQMTIRCNGNKYTVNSTAITQVDWYGYYARFRISQTGIDIPVDSLIAANFTTGTVEIDANL
jgi:hypothetical protein